MVQLSTVPTLIDDGPAAAPRRPASVRGEQRRRRLGAARRPDPGRPARGRAGGEQQPGRRQQGHLGAQPAAAAARARVGARRRRGGRVRDRGRHDPSPPARRHRRPPRRVRPPRCRHGRRGGGRRVDRPEVTPSAVPLLVGGAPARSAVDRVLRSSRAAAADRSGRRSIAAEVGDAEPDRGVDVLDRPLRRARPTTPPGCCRPTSACSSRTPRAREVDSCRNLLALMSIDDVEDPEPTPPTCCGCSCYDASRADLDLLRPGRPPGTTPGGPAR